MAHTPGPVRRWFRRFLWAGGALVMMLALVIVAVRVLLVCDETDPPWGTHLYLWDDHAAWAAQWVKAKPGRTIMIPRKLAARPMQLGVLPRFEDHIRQKLIGLGVPAASLRTAERICLETGNEVSYMENSLQDEPGAEIVLPVDRLSSGRMGATLRHLPSDRRSHYRIFPVGESIHETNWWYHSGGPARVLREFLLRSVDR